MFKKLTALISSIACAAGMLMGMGLTADAATEYNDVPTTHWAYQYIQRCSATNWFSGYPDGTFHPNDSITRAEAIKVFVTFRGMSVEPVKASTFPDVSATKWYTPYIEAGYYLFPQRTTPDGQKIFQPDMPVTREDTMYGIVKALGQDKDMEVIDESILNMYVDQNSISTQARPYIARVSQLGIVEGNDEHKIDAQEPLTRAEFAKLLACASELPAESPTDVKITSVDLYPSVLSEMLVGDSLEIKAIAHYTDGSEADYSLNARPYAETDNGVININLNKITALKEGTVVVKFNDDELSGKNLVINVKDGRSAPVVQITGYPTSTSDASAAVTGKVTDSSGSTIALSCNNSAMIMNSDGTFTANVNLNLGVNRFEFKAVNGANKEGTAVIEITRTEATPTPAPATPEPTEAPTPRPTPKEVIIYTPEPTPETVYPDDDPVEIFGEVLKYPTEDDRTMTIRMSYAGLSEAKVTAAGFVLEVDEDKYTFDSSESTTIANGIMRYQRADSGVRFSYSSSSGLSEVYGMFADIVLELSEDYDVSDVSVVDDFRISSPTMTNGTASYSDDIYTGIY